MHHPCNLIHAIEDPHSSHFPEAITDYYILATDHPSYIAHMLMNYLGFQITTHLDLANVS